jgi:hypothetical protein
VADKIYNKFKDQLVKAVYDWTSGTPVFRIIFVDSTSTYVASDAHNFVADFTSNGGVELPNITGYVGGYGGSGRKAVGTRAVTRDDATLHGEKLTAANLTWTAIGAASGKTLKAFLLVQDITSDALSPLVAYFDSAGSLALNGSDVTLTWGADGVMTLV